ncbi:MAG TPA: TIGR02147 family protein [Chitinispirillaceae bacterium]|nr:TIGR02147 family protein [Chitinispirillaceae bacterium]
MNTKLAQRFNIFHYTNYRILLKEYYSHQKKEIRSFSFRYFALKADVSASMFKDIIDGRRRLSLKVMQKYATAMNLSPRETEYFGAVVQFVNSRSTEEKNLHFSRILRLRGNSRVKFIDKEQYEFFRCWYHSVLREMVTLPDFREDYNWIAKRCIPRITAVQAKNSIELMLQLGILQRNEQGKLVPSNAVISSDYEIKSLTLRNFHTEMIGLAKEALDRFEPNEREISSLTLGLSQVCYERIKERIRTFKQELLSMVVEDTTDSEIVCQCNFQLFPLMEKNQEVRGKSNES